MGETERSTLARAELIEAALAMRRDWAFWTVGDSVNSAQRQGWAVVKVEWLAWQRFVAALSAVIEDSSDGAE